MKGEFLFCRDIDDARASGVMGIQASGDCSYIDLRMNAISFRPSRQRATLRDVGGRDYLGPVDVTKAWRNNMVCG